MIDVRCWKWWIALQRVDFFETGRLISILATFWESWMTRFWKRNANKNQSSTIKTSYRPFLLTIEVLSNGEVLFASIIIGRGGAFVKFLAPLFHFIHVIDIGRFLGGGVYGMVTRYINFSQCLLTRDTVLILTRYFFFNTEHAVLCLCTTSISIWKQHQSCN
jgi:hypothetical protein